MPNERAQYLVRGGSGRKVADGYVAIVDAVDSGRPFMVRVATDVLAIDADNEAEVKALAVLEREIRNAGGHPVAVMSGRDGGRHLLVRTGFMGWWRWERRARELRLDVREWIRPPLAPHPAARRVGLVELAVQEALDALDGPRRGVLPLSESTENLLAGRGLERYGSRSEALQAIATAMYGGRWPKEQFRQNVMASSFWRPVVEEHGGIEWLNRSWRSAETYVRAQRARDAAKVAQVRAAFDIADWSGPGRRTQRLIMEAHLRRAEWRGWSRHAFPRGDLAAEVGMNEKSITRLWSALVDAGWLKRGSGGQGKEAVMWRVAVPPTAQTVPPISHTPQEGESWGDILDSSGWDVGHDGYRWGALGKAATEVFAVLHRASGQPMTAVAIAAECPTKPSVATVSRVLTKARENGLATRLSHQRSGWLLVDWAADGLNRAALAAGKLGKREAQIQANIDARLERRDPSTWAETPREADPYWVEVAPFVRSRDDPRKATHEGTGEVVLVEDILAGRYSDEQRGIPARQEVDEEQTTRDDTPVTFGEPDEEEEERWRRSS